MVSRFSSIYDRLVLGSPAAVLVLLACVLGYFAYYIEDFKLDASADSILLENDEDLKLFREVNRRYGTRDYLFVTFRPEQDLFADAALAVVGALREEFRKLERVESVLTLLDVPLVKQQEGGLSEIAKNYGTLESAGVDRALARQELTRSPIYSDLVVSRDGATTALVLNLKNDELYESLLQRRNALIEKRHAGTLTSEEEALLQDVSGDYDAVKTALGARNHECIVQIRAIMSTFRDSGELHLGGVTMIADDMITFIKNDLVVFGWGVFVFLVAMLSVIFRELRWVVLPLLSCAYAGMLMVGLLGLVGWRVTVISSNFISLMLIITMSMNVHLVVRYRQLRRDFPEWTQHQTVKATTEKMVWPCLYTALTTIMAFTSLVVSDIKPVIDFGWMMTIGLTVTFLTSFLLFPAILVMLSPSTGVDSERSGSPFTAYLSRLTERHGNKVLAGAAVVGAISVYGVTKLEVENSFISYFNDSTEIYQGLKLIDESLGGTTPLDIILKFETDAGVEEVDPEFAELFGVAEKSDYWFTPEKIDLIKAVHDYLESLPAVGKVLSLASVVRVAEDLHQGEAFDTFQFAIIYKRLPEELKRTMLEPYVSLKHDEARITLRIRDSQKDLRRKELLHEIEDALATRFDLGPADVQVTGLLVLYNNMLQSLFRSQILTLGVVMLGIAVMLLVLFRSVSLAIIGIIPNVLAAAMILGLMGLAGIPLDMMTITIAAITIGIAVDNAIHYIYRFREEYARSGDYIETLHYCHANIGKAVFYTAITIIVGFSILVLSNFIPTIYFGVLTALAMAIALFAALTLLPKLLLVWKPY